MRRIEYYKQSAVGSATEYLISDAESGTEVKHCIRATAVDMTTALSVAGAVGIYDGTNYWPLVYQATPTAGQPITVSRPFLLRPGDRVYYMTNQATAGDDRRLALFFAEQEPPHGHPGSPGPGGMGEPMGEPLERPSDAQGPAQKTP